MGTFKIETEEIPAKIGFLLWRRRRRRLRSEPLVGRPAALAAAGRAGKRQAGGAGGPAVEEGRANTAKSALRSGWRRVIVACLAWQSQLPATSIVERASMGRRTQEHTEQAPPPRPRSVPRLHFSDQVGCGGCSGGGDGGDGGGGGGDGGGCGGACLSFFCGRASGFLWLFYLPVQI
jgi:hypothetical protein